MCEAEKSGQFLTSDLPRRRGEKLEGQDDPSAFWERRLLKPLPDFGGNSEMRELGAQIQRDVLSQRCD